MLLPKCHPANRPAIHCEQFGDFIQTFFSREERRACLFDTRLLITIALSAGHDVAIFKTILHRQPARAFSQVTLFFRRSTLFRSQGRGSSSQYLSKR